MSLERSLGHAEEEVQRAADRDAAAFDRNADSAGRFCVEGPNVTKFVMLITAAVVSVCVQPLAAVADEVPTLDVRKSCGADVQAYPGGGGSAACLADEQKAREALINQWTQFGAESRVRCTQMVNDIAGTQSYVELLSCL